MSHASEHPTNPGEGGLSALDGPAADGFEPPAEAAPFDLTCYVLDGWKPRIRPAPAQRDWMDETPDAYAYRCLPLAIANAHGWELLCARGFEAEWTGGPGVADVLVRADPGPDAADAPVSLFGAGVLTFHVPGLFRTPPGYSLWVGGSPNLAKDGLAPLSAIVETDWSPYTFTMNWRFTRPGQVIRFEENEPYCFVFPLQRDLVQRARPRVEPMEAAPDLRRQFEAWSRSRNSFQAQVAESPPPSSADAWQKAYYRGLDADGRPGSQSHCSKLRLRGFAGAEPPPAPARPAVAKRAGGSATAGAGPSAGKYACLLDALHRQHNLAASRPIPRLAAVSAEEFLDRHYAANWPALLAGVAADWPALRRWTPAHLKAAVGPAMVQVQAPGAVSPGGVRGPAQPQRSMGFSAFLNQALRPQDGDCCLRAAPGTPNGQALRPLLADLGTVACCQPAEATPGALWIASTGAFTPLHQGVRNTLLVQLVGQTQLLLIAPDATPRLYNDEGVYSRVLDIAEPHVVDWFPKLEGLRVHRVTLAAGDALFIPLGWWRQGKALEFTICTTSDRFRWPNDFDRDHPELKR